MKRFIVALLLLPTISLAYISPGKPTGFVNDFAKLLTQENTLKIENSLRGLSETSGAEVSVVTVESLGGDTIENFAVKLFEEWKIGKAKEDNGLLLLIAKEEREVRIEVGYGLEPVITDIESSMIINDVITPNFSKGQYDDGIIQAVEMISSLVRGEGQPVPKEDVNFRFSGEILFFVFVILASLLGRSKSWWAGGLVGGVVAIILGFIFSLKIGLFWSLVLVPLGLLFDYLVSKHYGTHKNIWFGGGGHGGGFGGGGFGGFGGGSSGGGGASGRW